MIRRFRITIENFIYIFLRPHSRLVNRQNLYKILLYPFIVMMAEFLAWRNKAITKAYVTNETISLEWYLNHLFDPALRRITIDTQDGDGLVMGMEEPEPDLFAVMGMDDEDSALIGLPGENTLTGIYSFAVFIPAALDSPAIKDGIKGVVNKKRFAGKTFTIITT